MHYHQAGECKFADQLTTCVSPYSPSGLCELRDEIELRNLGSGPLKKRIEQCAQRLADFPALPHDE